MADLDNLQIQIKASSADAISAIDKLIGALSRLNSSLNNYKSGSQYAQGMESLATGLERVSRAVNGIDDKKIRNLTSAISALNKAGSNLSVGKSISSAEKELDSLAKKKESQLSQTNKIGNASSLQQVAQGLQTIQSVGALPDFSGLGILAQNINRLSTENATKLATTLPQIVTGLRAFSGLNISNFPNIDAFARGLQALNKMGYKSASEATNNLPKLAESLRGFQGITVPDLGNVESFASALRSLGTGNIVKASQSLQPLADGLKDLSGIQLPTNVEGLTEFVKAINSLGRENTATAIENLPRLAQAFNELVASINQGAIGERTVQFAQALAQVSRASNTASAGMRTVHQQAMNWDNLFTMLGAKIRGLVNGGLRGLANYLKSIGGLFVSAGQKVGQFATSLLGIRKHADESATSLTNLARAIGKFWASAFWIINGLRGLWKSIESSMNYIETLNYFKASFKQISETAVGNWETLGYESAEAYADSFEKRAKQLTSKMTGFTIEDSGVLSMTGGKTLGLNPNTLLNYQAQFAQMASSMGASANNATLLSQALVEIGADLASVKNMKFEDVWQDMASGSLAGMSRTLDKYGVNVRKTAMNQKLLELGIETTAEKLSSADKAMLRTIILLDSTKYAWGDLANTINLPANQLRLLTANLQNCARMLGNIFLPIVAKVLPYLNAITIAVQRLLTFIAQILGIDIGKITSGVGGSNEAISDLLDDADNLDDSLDDASQSAKKLKNNLLGVDELNIVGDNITSADANGNMASILDDSFLDALSEYQDAWDKAFEAMENRANELADKIVAWFKELFKPISEAWAKVGDKVKKAWEKAFKSLGETLKSIFKDVWDVWQSPLNVKIFENLFEILANIGEIVANLSDNFRKAWEEGGRGKSILTSLQQIFWALTENAKELSEYVVDWAKNLDFSPLLSSIDGLLKELANDAYDIFGIWQDWYKLVIFPLGKYLIETFFPSIINSLTKMSELIDTSKLRQDIAVIFESLEGIAELVGNVLLKAFDRLATIIGENFNPFFENLSKSFKNLYEDLKKAENVNDVLNAIFNFGDDRAVDLGKFIHFLSENINKALEQIDFKNVGKRLAGMINKFLDEVDVNELAGTIAGLINALFDLVLGFIGKLDWFKVGQLIGDTLRKIDWLKVLQGVFEVIWGVIQGWFGSLGSAPFETLLLTALGIGGIGNSISKALTGKGLLANLFSSITGIGKESKGFSLLGKSAKSASEAKLLFNQANKKLGAGADNSTGKLNKEKTILSKFGGIVKKLAGAFLAFEGSKLAITNFADQMKEGFSWLDELPMLAGIALAGVGAVLMGAPAMVAGIVSAVVGVVATGVVLVKEHWEEITQWFAGIGDKLAGAWETLKTKFGELKQYIKDHWGEITEALKYGVRDVGEGFGQQFDKMKEVVSTFIQNTIQKFVEWKDNLLLTIGEWATSAWEKISTWATDTWQSITDWVSNTANAISEWASNTIGSIVQWVSDAYDAISSWIADTYEAVTQWASDVWGKVEEWASNVVGTLKRWYQEATDAIKNWFGEIIEKFQTWKETVENIVDAWKTTVVRIFNEWKEAVITIFEAWRKAVGDVLDGLKEFITKIGDWCREAVDKFIEFKDNAIEAFRQFKDGVREFIEEFVRHFKEHIGEFVQRAKEAFEDFKTRAVNAFQTFFNEGIRNIMGFIDNTRGKFVEWKDRVLSIISNLKEGAVKLFQQLWSDAKEWFSEKKWTFDGIKEGLKQAIMSAWELAQNLMNSFHDWLATLPSIFEDLRVKVAEFASKIGQSISQGASSFVDTAKKAGSAMGNAIATTAGNAWNGAKSGWQDISNKANQFYEDNTKKLKELAHDLWYGKYATGGFPEDGWFRASHGEIMGQFDNGKSVVANNEQITDGIARAVYSAMMDAGMGGGREEELLEELIQAVRNGQHISIDGRELVNAYDNRKTRNGYAFT